MPSTNHQLPEYQDNTVAKYRKVTTHAIGGTRLHPSDNSRLPFLLESKFSNFDAANSRVNFDYDTDVIELYSEQEAKVFKKLNPYLFTSGMIQEFEGNAPALVDNTLTQRDINRIANIKELPKFKQTLQTITSAATIQRVKETLEDLDRPKSFYTAIEDKLQSLLQVT